MRRFVNFSNHPHEKWEQIQLNAARAYGEIVDLTFPEVDPYADEKAVNELADIYAMQILALKPAAVMCQGEFTLVYSVIKRLKERNISVLAACSRRDVTEEDGKKISEFHFARFREYTE